MNCKLLLTAVLLGGSALITAGCASGEHRRSGGEVISDGAITAKVKTALLAEKDISSMEIKVETFNGTVQLSGFVNSQWQIDRAGQVARGVSGVQSVKNDLIHKPS